MVAAGAPVDWPLPEELFEWLGEANISPDGQMNAILGARSAVVGECYTHWYNGHRETMARMDVMAMDLQAANKEKKSVLTLKGRVAALEKEAVTLRDESVKYHSKADKWAERYAKLADDYQTLRTTANATPGVQNTIIQKIKPFEPNSTSDRRTWKLS